MARSYNNEVNYLLYSLISLLALFMAYNNAKQGIIKIDVGNQACPHQMAAGFFLLSGLIGLILMKVAYNEIY